MKNHLSIIIGREYKTRVKRKSFIITTILTPFLFILLMALPTLLAMFAGPEEKHVAIVDNSGFLSKAFINNGSMEFEVSDMPLDSLKARDDIDAILVIPDNAVERPDNIMMYVNGSPSPQTEMYISQILSGAIEQEKLSRYDIEGLDKIIEDIHTDVSLRTIRIDGEDEKEASSIASYMIGLILTMVLYMFIMLYGQMVMTSIIEEKNNRVLELVVSSVRPTDLMLGKILGIGAVAVTQILIWGVIIAAFAFGVMPSLVSSALAAENSVELSGALGQIGDPGFILGMFGMMALFLVLGYLFYSSIYAAIGSAVDNIQDASQLQIFALLPIILAMVFSMSVLNDPGSTFAVWLSMIPFTSPMVMMARLPFGIDTWQIVVSLAILVLSMFAMVWISAKIYRVGIFMYGKKPTVKDLIRWARYK